MKTWHSATEGEDFSQWLSEGWGQEENKFESHLTGKKESEMFTDPKSVVNKKGSGRMMLEQQSVVYKYSFNLFYKWHFQNQTKKTPKNIIRKQNKKATTKV